MNLRLLPSLLFAFAAFAIPGAVSRSATAAQAVELRLATLAPSGSSWMKVFNAWNLTIKEQTDNAVSLRFYDGGSQGD
jgi:TRAP-type C4-dicarboxylate transport system substrate-binding protein